MRSRNLRKIVALSVATICGVIALLNIVALIWPSPVRDEHTATATMVVLLSAVPLLLGIKAVGTHRDR